MLFWSGHGIVVFLLPLAFSVVAILLGADQVFSIGVALFLSGPILWFLGKNWNASPHRVVYNEKKGEAKVKRFDHSFSNMRVEFYGPVFFVSGLLFVLSDWTSGYSLIPGVLFYILYMIGFYVYKMFVEKKKSVAEVLAVQPVAVDRFGNPVDLPVQYVQQSASGKIKKVDPAHVGISGNGKIEKRSGKVSAKKETDFSRLSEEQKKKKEFYDQIRQKRDEPQAPASTDHSKYLPK